ncbi:MAG: oligoribonuclease [Bifidobacteriaceae bacterium]|jgi:oligoribonuclease|nr:oligoribonuclease [Bifidobacteriaceae bacterium]
MLNHTKNPAALLWMDLEMTGLNPVKDEILEVAAIITDWQLNKLAVYKQVQKVNPELLKQRMVGEFWETNYQTRDKLIEQNFLATKQTQEVEKELLKFIKQNFSTKQNIYLSGNSIHQDRKFIAQHWPKLDKRLHYRMLDISAFKLFFANVYNKDFAKNQTHRAIDDIKESISELTFYNQFIKP